MTGTRAPRPVQLVVFDFDGTLCDSADIKTVAFHRLYLDEHGPAFADEVEQFHLANAGLPRFDKIRFIESEMLGTEPSDERIDEVAAWFSELVEDAVVAAPMFEGVQEFLEASHERVPLTIASATPTGELRRIVKRKGIEHFFRAIEGSPESKADIISRYSAIYDVAPAATAMVGDQPSDAAAAEATGAVGIMIADEAPWVAHHIRVDTFSQAAAQLNRMLPPPT